MSQTRKLWIPGPAGRLEAALRIAYPPRATAVVAHPHPMYGGTMDNAVVFHADRELHREGFTTLRFNFRGVGASSGEHDSGGGETEDLAAASTWIRGTAPDRPQILVGYSFGSWCAVRRALVDASVVAVIAIGLPTRVLSFDGIGRLEQPLVVVQGTEDEFGPADEIRNVLRKEVPTARVIEIEGATHLFTGFARQVGQTVARVAEELLRDSAVT